MTVNTFIPLASAAPIVDFTPVGRQKVIERLGEEQKQGVRFSLLGGGCAGFSYVFDYAEEKEPEDIEIDFDEFKLWICPMSEKYLKGTVIDWKKQGLNQTFIYMNPNEASSCGCGTSASFEI
tara:strand:- start:1208 stop:1573 length:366 start_codon:yes stop_codon:yes gene_type:complete